MLAQIPDGWSNDENIAESCLRFDAARLGDIVVTPEGSPHRLPHRWRCRAARVPRRGCGGGSPRPRLETTAAETGASLWVGVLSQESGRWVNEAIGLSAGARRVYRKRNLAHATCEREFNRPSIHCLGLTLRPWEPSDALGRTASVVGSTESSTGTCVGWQLRKQSQPDNRLTDLAMGRKQTVWAVTNSESGDLLGRSRSVPSELVRSVMRISRRHAYAACETYSNRSSSNLRSAGSSSPALDPSRSATRRRIFPRPSRSRRRCWAFAASRSPDALA